MKEASYSICHSDNRYNAISQKTLALLNVGKHFNAIKKKDLRPAHQTRIIKLTKFHVSHS